MDTGTASYSLSPMASTTGGCTTGTPIPTAAPAAAPSRMSRDSSRSPAPVSTARCRLFVSPLSYTYLPKQRMPLPHMAPSEPSALNIRILKSARWDGHTQMMPSPPTPKCRSDRRRASSGRPSGVPAMQLIKM